LRPLSLGELLDRAFNLYFRNIAAFTAIVAIVIVPGVILSYFQSRASFGFLISVMQHAITSPGSTPDLSQLNGMMPNDALLGLQYALAFIGFPFAYAAVIAGVSKAYLGKPVLFGESYRFALRRWLAILVLLVLWMIFLVVAIFAAVAVFFVGAVIIIAVGRLVGPNGFFGVVGAILAIATMIAAIGVTIMMYLTSAMSFIAVVIEHVDPLKAFLGAFSRMFSVNQFWRGFALALALAGIYLAASFVTAAVGGIAAFLLKAPALYIIAIGLTSLFFSPVAVVSAAVFYYDVRIRREGYDLQMLAEHFATAIPPAAPGA
jgi:hypothetical protein